jgi:hypothetical protein
MKVALAIHLSMLALLGGLAWRVGGSPFLLAASMGVVLVYALLSSRPGQMVEITRFITSVLLVGLCPLYYGKDPNIFWLCLLALPQLLSATQCIWEIERAGNAKEDNSIWIRRSIFPLGFYATLGLAFVMMRADFLEMERSTGVMLAAFISLAGLIAWEASRARRLKKGLATNTLTDNEFLFRMAAAGLGAVMFTLLSAVVLPIASDALCQFSPNLKLPRDLPEAGPGLMPGSQAGKPGETQSGEGSDSDAGPEMANLTGQSWLPMRGTLELTEEVRLGIKFEASAQAEALTKEGPLYVRTLAVSRFNDGQWVSESSPGYWLKDATDGRRDGRVEVGKPMPGQIAHEVFLPQSKGDVLPALAGVTTYALPDLFVRSDDWFQSAATGDIRYKTWSKPVNIPALSRLKLEPGKPGEEYITRLSTPFGTRLTATAGFFTSQRADLSGRLDLLQQFFQKEFKYSMKVENKSGLPPLENFLFEERNGYCDFFASAAALILRHMDIPSRVAYGYKDGEYDTTTGIWIFRGFHAHAWTEIFVENQGWVICDFTPPSTDSSPRSGTPPPFDMADFKDAGESGTEGETKLWNNARSLRSLWVPAIAGVGVLGVIVSFLLRKRRTPEQRAAAKAVRERAGRDKQPEYFLEFLQMCQALGHPRLKGQTLMEFHRHLKQARFCNDDFDDLAAYYYKSRYEDGPRDEPREHGFLKRIREFRKARTDRLPSS